MKLISHRGNLNKKDEKKENLPSQIKKVIKIGYDCEIDVWFVNKKFYLGHDKPEHQVEEKFLENKKLWCHAKNIDALLKMLKNNKIHCFWHENDKVTLTSKGIIWAYPNKKSILDSVVLFPELNNNDISKCYGICSDVIEKYNK